MSGCEGGGFPRQSWMMAFQKATGFHHECYHEILKDDAICNCFPVSNFNLFQILATNDLGQNVPMAAALEWGIRHDLKGIAARKKIPLDGLQDMTSPNNQKHIHGLPSLKLT